MGEDRPVRGLRLVIFDCDGVLVDSEGLSNRVLAEMLTELGIPTTQAQARRDYQGLRLDGLAEAVRSRLGRELPAGWPERFVEVRAEVFRRELRAVAGAEEAVERVRGSGLAACVASQGQLEKTRLSLQITGLSRLFGPDELFSSWSVVHGKPHPDLFLHAAAAMGAEPYACAVVEDSVSGVRAGVAAGMSVLGYVDAAQADVLEAAGAGTGQLAAAGARTFDSMEQLPGLLGIA